MLGVLRKAACGLLAGQLEELEGNLMRLDAGQLAEHPMIREPMRLDQDEGRTAMTITPNGEVEFRLQRPGLRQVFLARGFNG